MVSDPRDTERALWLALRLWGAVSVHVSKHAINMACVYPPLAVIRESTGWWLARGT